MNRYMCGWRDEWMVDRWLDIAELPPQQQSPPYANHFPDFPNCYYIYFTSLQQPVFGHPSGGCCREVTVGLPLSCWTRINPAFANSVDPDQLASEEANWYGSALFAIKYVNL